MFDLRVQEHLCSLVKKLGSLGHDEVLGGQLCQQSTIYLIIES